MNSDFNDLNDFVKSNNSSNKLRLKKRKKITIFFINIFTIAFLLAGGFGLKVILEHQNDLKEAEILQTSIKEELQKLKQEQLALIEQAEKEEAERQAEEKAKEEERINQLVSEQDRNSNNYKNNYNEYVFDSLYSQNNDTIGWIIINDTNIDFPVVQASNNSYYLNHNFQKKYNTVGWIFADYRNSFPNLSRNTILYGHTMKNGLMFSSLINVLNNSWLNNESNRIIEFGTSEGTLYWEIFSVYTTPVTNDYTIVDFTDENFIDFVDEISEKSIRDFGVEITKDDKILTLSTCYKNNRNRLIVHAKLLK